MNRKNLIAIACVFTVMLMTGAAFAAVPLYQLFCQVTGFDGTVKRAEVAPDKVLDETVLIRFDTNVRGLPMTFRAEQVSQRVRIGETGIAFFNVTNTSDRPIHATAAYNVVPERAGPYFQKLQCFCFEGQVIAPGQTMKFPVQYFVAPEIATDRESRGVREITLSYTFYPTKGAQDAANPAPATGAAA
ncbi:MAG: cytochrome c oxidase assembly protein [Brevundimonas sp.]|uniref:cytochrome c oxidase assembly protein n=1 Tax=Brevundimonas sp. TaxID=1871086 RepID=UPI00261B31C8|nr:cytochrome c oxidase assembly protein [Brevundimonas sp.]MDI6624869.1 cytochrome c oxidase assembly protein [Brevundimonas sp.]MDQ7813730.1 cytochrome c oxidase assembly protein [Brevundimonas sp.]